MITFRKVVFKNFLSTGNTPTDIDLDKHSTTLVIGDNGSGKSTMLDALCFGLFGKAFRNIKKDQLVNSVNERDCRVEVHFQIGRAEYLIIRGIKPNRFEIYKNGTMLNQDASARDYQKHLETNILKLNYRSFTQVVILGSSSFIPFMQLTAAHRRDVVEEILDIKIFSLMNTILKIRLKQMKETQKDIAYQSQLTETKITMAQEHIEQTEEKRKTSKDKLKDIYDDNKKNVEKLQEEASNILSEFVQWRDIVSPKHDKLIKDKSELSNTQWKMNQNSDKNEKEIEFFKENDECPTCEQVISEEFKEIAIEKRTDKMVINACNLVRLDEQLSEMDARNKLYVDIASDMRDKEVDAAKKTTSASSLVTYNDQLLQQIEDLSKVDQELTEEKTKLKSYKGQLQTIDKKKEKLTDDNNYLTIAKQLLQDSGIKTKIIKRYLPVMNKLINSYLSALEFQVKFELDEEFNETIKSRYRDVFGYANFSEGEKMRIDLALLFTWRQIAKMKNSTNTNLLILDEIFDSSLDYNGTDEFLKIISTLSNENIFIISHKSDLSVDKFEHLIRFEKVQNFSKVTS